MSPIPSFVKSAIATPAGVAAVASGEPAAAVNTPVANATGSVPVATGDPLNSANVPLNVLSPVAWKIPIFCVAEFSTAISGLPELSKVPDNTAIGPFSVVGNANGDFGNGVN